jgi:hypothetical protein
VADETDQSQAERTALSWMRTALAAAGTSALFVRLGVVQSEPLLLYAGLVDGVAALAAYGLGRRRVLQVVEARASGRAVTLQPMRALGLAGVVTVTALAVLVAIVL